MKKMRANKIAKLECIQSMKETFTLGKTYNASSLGECGYEIIDDEGYEHDVGKPTEVFFDTYFKIVSNSESVFNKEAWLDNSYYLKGERIMENNIIELHGEIDYCPYCGSTELNVEGDNINCDICGRDFTVMTHE